VRSQLDIAVEDRIIGANPAAARKLLPKVSGKRRTETARRKVEQNAWELAPILTFIDSRTDVDDPLVALWSLAFAIGARRGELLALRWSDISGLIDDEPLVTIDKAYVRGEHGVELTTTKGGESRSIPILLPEFVTPLRRHREHVPGIGDGLVFTNPVHGGRLDPDVVSQRFVTAVSGSGTEPRLTMHGTRHSFVTWTLQADIPVEVVSKWAGHSTPEFTLTRYRHVLPDDHRQAVERAGVAAARARRRMAGGAS
jgi:integrase